MIATFIVRDATGTLARRDQPGETLPLKLHGIFLDAAAGKVQAAKEWPTARPRGGIVPAGDKRFLVLTPAVLALYSGGLEPLSEFSFSLEQQAHLFDVRSSPTGKSILVEYNDCMPNCSAQPPVGGQDQEPDTSFQWLDIGSMQAKPPWSENLPSFTISDSELAFVRSVYTKSTGFVHEVVMRSRDGSERAFCRVRPGHATDTGCGFPQFVSDKVLALWLPHSLSLIPVGGGDALLAAKFSEDEWIGPRGLHPSADGKRLALAVSAHKGGSEILDIDYHTVLKRIMVFDIPSRSWIYTLEAKKHNLKAISGLALSPDGTRMAVLADGVVEVYQLPDAEAHVASGGSL